MGPAYPSSHKEQARSGDADALTDVNIRLFSHECFSVPEAQRRVSPKLVRAKLSPLACRLTTSACGIFPVLLCLRVAGSEGPRIRCRRQRDKPDASGQSSRKVMLYCGEGVH